MTENISKDFRTFLDDQPALTDRLNHKLADLVKAIVDTGKTGSLTLTIKLEPLDDDVEQLKVAPKVTLKAPEHDQKPAIFYPTPTGLSREDPTQAQFDLKQITPTPTTVKEVK